MSKNYRKIYESYHQASLLDGIDIHHVDGNHNNNDPTNLQAVTLQEHYDLHKARGDHYACVMIAQRMKIKPDDWKQMAKENGRKSAIKNKENDVGLLAWIKNNPELAKKQCKVGGKVGGKKAANLKLGFHSLTKEEKIKIASLGGKTASELNLGFKAGHASEAGKIGGKKGGAYAKENKTGIFALTPEQNKIRHQNSVKSRLANKAKRLSEVQKNEDNK